MKKIIFAVFLLAGCASAPPCVCPPTDTPEPMEDIKPDMNESMPCHNVPDATGRIIKVCSDDY